MHTALRPGESVVREGAANLQKNIETVGGKLYLTTQRLVFEAHVFNVQGGTTEVELPAIASVEPCWTKFLGFLPIMPNSLAVRTSPGPVFRFVLWKRQDWAAAIDGQRRG